MDLKNYLKIMDTDLDKFLEKCNNKLQSFLQRHKGNIMYVDEHFHTSDKPFKGLNMIVTTTKPEEIFYFCYYTEDGNFTLYKDPKIKDHNVGLIHARECGAIHLKAFLGENIIFQDGHSAGVEMVD